eukprot:538426_1
MYSSRRQQHEIRSEIVHAISRYQPKRHSAPKKILGRLSQGIGVCSPPETTFSRESTLSDVWGSDFEFEERKEAYSPMDHLNGCRRESINDDPVSDEECSCDKCLQSYFRGE